MTPLNVCCKFRDGTVINLEGDDCRIQDRDMDVAMVSRAQILRFVNTLMARQLELICGEEIASTSYIHDPTDDDG